MVEELRKQIVLQLQATQMLLSHTLVLLWDDLVWLVSVVVPWAVQHDYEVNISYVDVSVTESVKNGYLHMYILEAYLFRRQQVETEFVRFGQQNELLVAGLFVLL